MGLEAKLSQTQNLEKHHLANVWPSICEMRRKKELKQELVFGFSMGDSLFIQTAALVLKETDRILLCSGHSCTQVDKLYSGRHVVFGCMWDTRSLCVADGLCHRKGAEASFDVPRPEAEAAR